jgi:hypothetical protein
MTSPAANYIGPVFVFHPKVIKFKGLVAVNKSKKAYGVSKCKMKQFLAKLLSFFSKPISLFITKSILLSKTRNYKMLLLHWLLHFISKTSIYTMII